MTLKFKVLCDLYELINNNIEIPDLDNRMSVFEIIFLLLIIIIIIFFLALNT